MRSHPLAPDAILMILSPCRTSISLDPTPSASGLNARMAWTIGPGGGFICCPGRHARCGDLVAAVGEGFLRTFPLSRLLGLVLTCFVRTVDSLDELWLGLEALPLLLRHPFPRPLRLRLRDSSSESSWNPGSGLATEEPLARCGPALRALLRLLDACLRSLLLVLRLWLRWIGFLGIAFAEIAKPRFAPRSDNGECGRCLALVHPRSRIAARYEKEDRFVNFNSTGK